VEGRHLVAGHAFLSYVREDSDQADRLQRALEDAGIPVWRDTSDLWPGEDWRLKIRNAITDGALVFLACFSRNSLARTTSYQNEELVLAIEQLRQRRPEQPWLIPVRFDESETPDRDIGGGRMLSSLQRVDVFGDRFDAGVARLVEGIGRILGPSDEVSAISDSHGQGEAPGEQPQGARAAGAGGVPRAGQAGQDRPAEGAFTARWRYTSDGFQATPLMNMVNTAMPGHPGSQDQSPFVRVGVCVASDPISPDAGSSRVGSGFIRFLRREPVAGLSSALAHVDAGVRWERLAGHGILRLEAALGDISDGAKPAASAMLLPPVSDMQMYGRAEGVACLWLHFEPRTSDGSAAPPASLAEWHARMQQAISLAVAFTAFVTEELRLETRPAPAARVGVLMNAPRSMRELVDIGSLRMLPNAIPSSQFLGYAIADPAGKADSDIARDMLGQLCEYTLHLDDYETVLDAL
jgi:hypothetical protein